MSILLSIIWSCGVLAEQVRKKASEQTQVSLTCKLSSAAWLHVGLFQHGRLLSRGKYRYLSELICNRPAPSLNAHFNTLQPQNGPSVLKKPIYPQINLHLRMSTSPSDPTELNFSLWCADVHRLHPGGCQPVPAAAHLLRRSDPPLHQQEDRWNAASHLCHRRQLLLQHAEEQPGPVLHHQVSRAFV